MCTVPSAPVSIRVEAVEGQPDQLSLAWQPPEVPNGLIVQYAAYCFEISDDEVYRSGYLGEADSLPPFEDITSNATVTGNDSKAVVDGLEPYTRYACFVTAYTSIGEGEPSYASPGVTAESGELINSSCDYSNLFSQCHSISVPASPPINLIPDMVGSTYVLLSWSPPTIPNGRIVSYTVTYNLTQPETSVVVRSGEQYTVMGLDPYSYYQFRVFASTSAGDGPPTPPIAQRTAIDSKLQDELKLSTK